jgi:hypothetical protein
MADKRRVAPTKLPAPDVTAAEQIADRSNGWMVEQVIGCAASYVDGKPYADPPLSDYAEWCAEDGEKEIDAAGLEDPARAAVLKRWQPFITAAKTARRKPPARRRGSKP